MIFTSYQEHLFDQAQGFLVIDGVNGAGKSTLLARLAAYLTEAAVPFVQTREPGATNLGKQIRPLLLANEEKLSTLAELFLFAADRAEHVQKLILPALRERKLVLSDRYYYSTFAFQGFGREIDLELINSITSIAIAGVHPDLVLLLDLDPAEGLRRTKKRNSANGAADVDNFEKEELAFHTRLRRGYLEVAKQSAEPMVLLDGSMTPEEVWNQAKQFVDPWISAVCSRWNTVNKA